MSSTQTSTTEAFNTTASSTSESSSTIVSSTDGLIYVSILLGLVAAVAVILADRKQISGILKLFAGSDDLACFQRLYLPGFLLAMLADWLQGPFIYALYEAYGIDREHNGYLFVVGFGASALFGTIAGSLADKFGRRKFAILYCLMYFGHCATKHWGVFGVLLVGRVLGGISTSLLFSVFDAWLVSESQQKGFDQEQLGNTFSLAYFGSSLAAIAAGQLGEIAAELIPFTPIGGGMYYGGYITPFDLANVCLVLCLVYISNRWSENYGESESGGQVGCNLGELRRALCRVFDAFSSDKRVLLCGLICSFFESSMYLFVFNWTPCLMEEGHSPPKFGLIFTGFMIFCLLGTRIYSCLSGALPVEQIGLLVMLVSGACHLTVFLLEDVIIRFVAFLAFEFCVGLYFPMIGTLKGDIVPEETRSTIYSIYRLPLNLVVLLPLLMNFSISTTFSVTTALLGIAASCALYLVLIAKSVDSTSFSDEDVDSDGDAKLEAAKLTNGSDGP